MKKFTKSLFALSLMLFGGGTVYGTTNHMLRVTNGEAGFDLWDHQAFYVLPAALTSGTTYVIEFDAKAVNGGGTRVVTTVNNENPMYLATKGLWKNEFTRYTMEFTANGAIDKLEIDLGPCAGDVYIDNISLVVKEETTNLIANGNFEEDNLTGWSGNGNTLARVEYEVGSVLEPGILITVGEAGWKTFRDGSNVEITDPDVKAYVAKYVAEGNYIQLTQVTKIPSWQPVLIEAPQGYYVMESPESADGFPFDKNDLEANGGTALPGDGTLYGLAKVNDVVGFYKISTESAVPAWHIYMRIGSSSAPAFVGFGGTTGMEAVKVVKSNGEFFNLAGQRVANPTKGLYIVNGKKYIVK